MQQPKSMDTLEVAAGTFPDQPIAAAPFSEGATSFLSDLSVAIRSNSKAKQRPDLMAFSFWCRKANLAALKERFTDTSARLGLGTAFHIAPSNVPVNAFYSFAFGLLSGNANIIKLPSRQDDGAEIILRCIRQLFEANQHRSITDQNAFVRYDHTGNSTDDLSAICDIRIIWGGDGTINKVRQSPIGTRCRELAFADRYSFSVMNIEAVANASDDEVSRLATGFYNDTMQMDQNACSSPHLLVWLGKKNNEAKIRFWQAFEAYSRDRYSLDAVQNVDRYTRLLSGFIDGPEQQHTTPLMAPIQRAQVKTLPQDIDKLRGIYGLFYEYDATTLSEVAHIVNIKYQTLTYFGIQKQLLKDFVINGRLNGIDRIVPVGDALNIDMLWDGHNVLHEMTRIIDVR